MTLLASASLTDEDSINNFGTYTGTTLGSMTIDDNGTLLPYVQKLSWSSPENYTNITGSCHVSFELESRAIHADNAALASASIFPDSENALQSARASEAVLICYIASSDNQERFYGRFQVPNTYLQTLAYADGGALTNQFSRYSQRQDDIRYSSLSGVVYSKCAVSWDAENETVTFWVNGELRTTQSSATLDYGSNCVETITLGSTSAGIGDGTNNYYVRNLELHDEAYDPVKHDTTNTNKSIKVVMGIDSFALGAGNDDALRSEYEFGAMRQMQADLESKYGISTDILSGLAVNGQNMNTVTDGEIDSVLAKNPTDVILFPSVNDLGETSGVPGWSSGNDYSTWQTNTLRVVDRLGQGSTVKRVWLLSMWGWLNAAHSSGYTFGSGAGEFNDVAEAHWSDPQYISAMNRYFRELKTNTGLSSTTRSKLQEMIDIPTQRDANSDYQDYERNDTRASIPSTLTGWRDDLHPAPRQQMFVGRYLAAIIGNAILDPDNPSESLKDIIWNYGHRKRFKN